MSSIELLGQQQKGELWERTTRSFCQRCARFTTTGPDVLLGHSHSNKYCRHYLHQMSSSGLLPTHPMTPSHTIQCQSIHMGKNEEDTCPLFMEDFQSNIHVLNSRRFARELMWHNQRHDAVQAPIYQAIRTHLPATASVTTDLNSDYSFPRHVVARACRKCYLGWEYQQGLSHGAVCVFQHLIRGHSLQKN